MTRDATRVGEIVLDAFLLRAGTGETDREARNVPSLCMLLREGDDGTGIETTRQKGSDRHVGDHLALDGRFDPVVNPLDGFFGAQGLGRGVIGQIVIRPHLLDAPVARQHRMARQQLADALDHRRLAGAPLVRHVGAQRGVIDSPVHIGNFEKRFHLAGEEQPSLRLRIVEWLNADAVACSKKRARARIPNRKRENPVQGVEHVDSFPEIHLEKNFCVGLGPELKSRAYKFFTKLTVIVEFAIINQHDLAGVVEHGLVRGRREVDDGQAPMGEARMPVARKPDALAIGTSVGDAPAHRFQLDPLELAQISRNPTHRRLHIRSNAHTKGAHHGLGRERPRTLL